MNPLFDKMYVGQTMRRASEKSRENEGISTERDKGLLNDHMTTSTLQWRRNRRLQFLISSENQLMINSFKYLNFKTSEPYTPFV